MGLRTNNSLMNASVDRLFENDPNTTTSNETKINTNGLAEPQLLVESTTNGDDNKDINNEFQLQKQKLYDSIKDRNDFVEKNNNIGYN